MAILFVFRLPSFWNPFVSNKKINILCFEFKYRPRHLFISCINFNKIYKFHFNFKLTFVSVSMHECIKLFTQLTPFQWLCTCLEHKTKNLLWKDAATETCSLLLDTSFYFTTSLSSPFSQKLKHHVQTVLFYVNCITKLIDSRIFVPFYHN